MPGRAAYFLLLEAYLKGKGERIAPNYHAVITGVIDSIAKVLREGYEVNLLQDGLYELSAALTFDHLLIDIHPGLNEETLISIE